MKGRRLARREFLRLAGGVAAGVALSTFFPSCSSSEGEGAAPSGGKVGWESPPTFTPGATLTPASTSTPTQTPTPAATATPEVPSISFKVYEVGSTGGPEVFTWKGVSGLGTLTSGTEAGVDYWRTSGDVDEAERQILEKIAQDRMGLKGERDGGVILQRFTDGKEDCILALDEAGEPLYYAQVDNKGEGKVWPVFVNLEANQTAYLNPKDGTLEIIEEREGGQVRGVKAVVNEKEQRLDMTEVMGERTAVFDAEKGKWVAVEEMKEKEWTGMPEFKFVDDWGTGLEIRESKEKDLWVNMLRVMAAGELFRVIEGVRPSRGGRVNWAIVKQEYQALKKDPFRWQPSNAFLAEVDGYSQVMLDEMDRNNGLISGVCIPYIRRAQNDWGYHQLDVDMREVIINFTKVEDRNSMYGPIFAGESNPRSGDRMEIDKENHLVIKMMTNKPLEDKFKLSTGLSFALAGVLEEFITGYGNIDAFDRVYASKNNLRFLGKEEVYGVIMTGPPLFDADDSNPLNNFFKLASP